MRLSKRRFLKGAATLLAGAPRAIQAEEAPAPLVLTARRVRLQPPGATATGDVASFDGTANGPVLRLAKGAALDLSLTNGLDLAFALQWHGVRAPNAMAGEWPLVGARVAPGMTQAIRFVPPDSGLYWFHAATLPGQPDLTAEGLRGVLIVTEAAPPLADDDILLTLADGAAPAPLTVNGKATPERASVVPGGRLRLRILNGSTRRALILGIEGGRPLIVAIDGQPSDLFEPVRDQVPVGPGARFEFMIDAPGEAGATLRIVIRGGAGAADLPVFEARTVGATRTALPAMAALPRNPNLSPAIPLEQSVRADLRIEAAPAKGLARFALNGRASLDLPPKPLLTVRRGGAVTLGFDNRTGAIVALRVHGHVMRLLHPRDDGWEPYWRDSVLLLPGSVNHVAFVADNPGKWLLDSALYDQAAFGLRHWFEVT
jgi:FtsP/CotA-like multicopper oxidase with cupredoxin domain